MISAKKTWQAQNEILQAAVKERGNNAVNLFDLSNGSEYASNEFCRQVLNGLVNGMTLHLKPIAKLIEIDIQRYGDNAFLMYQWRHDYDDLECCGYKKDVHWKAPKSNKDCEDLANCINYIVERKLYANVPFNLEWAKAGVAVSHITGGDIADLKMSDGADYSPYGVINGVQTTFYDVSNLRHPFPPVCTGK